MKTKFVNSFKEAGIFALPLFFVYLFFQAKGIFGGDCGDLVAAASIWGIPHPPGYPLYTFLSASLIKVVPFFTPAWRVALLSSFSSALTVGLWFVLIKKLTKNFWIGLCGGLTLAFSYVFWLYAEVAEVFGLNSLFFALLIFLAVSWHEKPDKGKLLVFVFFLGLSLTHHHTIVFLLPALFYLFYTKKKFFSKQPKSLYLKLVGVFLLGLLPYLYLPIAAFFRPSLDWGYPVNAANFFRLVTRAVYGTFSSSPSAIQEAGLRLVQLPAYFLFLFQNITVAGVILAFIGMVFMNGKNKVMFRFFGLAFLFTGPFFVFYASFSLSGDFQIATFERFLLLSLPFVVVFMSFGMKEVMEIAGKKFKLVSKSVFAIIFLLLPVFLLIKNLPNMVYLKNDFFADRLGEEILSTAEPNSLLILSYDQPLFNSQYKYYAQKVRPDVKLIHNSLLNFDYYKNLIKKNYPEIIIPEEEDGEKFMQKFLEENSKQFPVYSNSDIVEGGWREPAGLLIKYHSSEESLPSNEEVIEKNNKLWRGYQDLGYLVEHRNYHLMALSIVDVYRSARSQLGGSYLEAGLNEQALEQFREAQALQEIADDYIFSGAVLSKLNKCGEAEDDFKKALELDEEKKADFYQSMFLNAKYCQKDEEKTKLYEDIFLNENNSKDTKLEEL